MISVLCFICSDGVSPSTFSNVGEIKFFQRDPSTNPGVPVYDVLVEIIFSTTSPVCVFERSNPSKPFVEPGDVVQGKLGDCYLLGALSVISTNQQLLFDIFPDIPDDLRDDELGF